MFVSITNLLASLLLLNDLELAFEVGFHEFVVTYQIASTLSRIYLLLD